MKNNVTRNISKWTLPFAIISCFQIQLSAQDAFNKYFTTGSLRLDYTHAGDFSNEHFFLEEIKMEPVWGGPIKNLIDQSGYGQYLLSVVDSASDELIYSRGFGTLFEEWRATDEGKLIQRSFYETQIFPFPRKTVKATISGRSKENSFTPLWKLYVNPRDYQIRKEKLPELETRMLINNGDPSNHVDIVIIPDGYTIEEKEKLYNDLDRFTGYFFNSSPYREQKPNFNFHVVYAYSKESGTDFPHDSIWRNTAVGTSFYTFGSERYLMTTKVKELRDICALVPYDQIYILVNSPKYGGGSIYNYYSACSSDNEASEFVFIHEFGHGFGGLADEYYTSEVAYQDIFNLEVEPWQPNITTLKNFGKKWKDLVPASVPIPTPMEEKYKDVVGVFEGAGYVAKGVYRPIMDCTMKSAIVDGFCPVCKGAIIRMIDFYSDK